MFFQGDVEEDEHIADKESDIKPRFHRAKSHTQKHTDPASGDGAGGGGILANKNSHLHVINSSVNGKSLD